MPKLGRPVGSGISNRKFNVTRALSLPADVYKKCVWIADRWTKDALVESADGSTPPEYWSVAKVISSVMAEYFAGLELQDPGLTGYFENCKARDAESKSIYKGKTLKLSV